VRTGATAFDPGPSLPSRSPASTGSRGPPEDWTEAGYESPSWPARSGDPLLTEARGTDPARLRRERAGQLVIDPAYLEALTDIEGFDRLWLIYWLDRAGPYRPLVTPYLDDRPHGVFATRSPARPVPIGLSVVRLLERRGSTLDVADLDVLDRTPLDVKPYVPRFDA
jgi:tRNA-Thr(GGU) m(6)t(6)A37 methyltransferase TsaA